MKKSMLNKKFLIGTVILIALFAAIIAFEKGCNESTPNEGSSVYYGKPKLESRGDTSYAKQPANGIFVGEDSTNLIP